MRALLMLMLVGCVEEGSGALDLESADAEPWAGPVTGQTPPPATLDLALSNLFSGMPASMTVGGLLPGERVQVGVTQSGPGAGMCPPLLGGQCLGLAGPVQRVATLRAQGATLALPFTAPSATGTEFCMQVAVMRGVGGVDSALSNVVCRTVFDPYELQPGPNESRDIWSTSFYAYDAIGGNPGGGLNEAMLRNGGWGDTYQSLIDIDVSGAPLVAQSAILDLYVVVISAGGPTDLMLDRVDAFWDWRTQGTGRDRERLWWADLPPATQIGGPFSSSPVGSWMSFDITDLYNSWQDGTQGAYGIQLRPTATWNNYTHFAASEEPNAAIRPRLRVVP